jgi:hypothetical protein
MTNPVTSIDKIELFAQTYVAGGARASSMRNAAVAAGLSEATSWNFFRRADVQKRVAELLSERYGELTITAQRIFEEMGAIALFDPAEMFDENGDLLPAHLMPPRVRAAIASYEFDTTMVGRGPNATPVTTVKVKMHSKNEMLKLMAQHFKLISDNEGINALATELTKQLREGRERARAVRGQVGMTAVEDAVIIPRTALPVPVAAVPVREDYA